MTIRDRKRSAQRARILDAARVLFSEQGPDSVTMADIASEAGVARATVFNHFGSKTALLEAITEEVISDYDTLVQNALAARDPTVPELVRALFEFMGEGVESHRRFHRAVFREIAKLTLGLDEGGPGQVVRQSALAHLVELFERGQQRGEISCDHQAVDLAMAFDSLVFGTITHWLYDDESESLRVRMRRAADVYLGGISLESADLGESPRPLPDVGAPRPTAARRRELEDEMAPAAGATAPHRTRSVEVD